MKGDACDDQCFSVRGRPEVHDPDAQDVKCALPNEDDITRASWGLPRAYWDASLTKALGREELIICTLGLLCLDRRTHPVFCGTNRG